MFLSLPVCSLIFLLSFFIYYIFILIISSVIYFSLIVAISFPIFFLEHLLPVLNFTSYFWFITSSISVFCSVSTFNICTSVLFCSLFLSSFGCNFFGYIFVFLFPDSLFQLSLLHFIFRVFLLLSVGSFSSAVVLALYVDFSVAFLSFLRFSCFLVLFY